MGENQNVNLGRCKPVVDRLWWGGHRGMQGIHGHMDVQEPTGEYIHGVHGRQDIHSPKGYRNVCK